MNILLVGTSFDRSYGGPALSVSRLALALAEEGVTIGLWAPDGSATRSNLVIEHPLLLPLKGTAADALNRFGKRDIVHDNGIWLSHNRELSKLAQQQRIPRVVSLRGMLEPWALKHKRWKKKAAWLGYQQRDLKEAQMLHATANMEAENVTRLGLQVPICTIPNGVDIPAFPNANDTEISRRNKGKLVVLFLSRIHPKKGLLMLIEAWSRVRPNDWVLHIAGPDEAGHQKEVEALVRILGLESVVSFLGSVEGKVKDAAYRAANLFVLPTHSENFGMVVAEALAHGVPVLTTRSAPWSLLETKQCGWWVEATVDAITEGLHRATAHDAVTLRAMGARGRSWVEQEFGWENIAKQFIAAYTLILSQTAASAPRMHHNA